VIAAAVLAYRKRKKNSENTKNVLNT
jgi:hypothetical protein